MSFFSIQVRVRLAHAVALLRCKRNELIWKDKFFILHITSVLKKVKTIVSKHYDSDNHRVTYSNWLVSDYALKTCVNSTVIADSKNVK